MADFDIEAYLDEQVSKSNRDEQKVNNGNKEKDVVKKSDERIDRRDRDSSRDRRSRRNSRDRKDERRRGRSRSRSRSRSNSRPRRRSSRSRSKSPDRKRTRDELKDRENTSSSSSSSIKSKAEQDNLVEKYQIEYERERKKLEEEAKRIEQEKQREVDDLTKDQRTIFVGQLTMKVSESHLKEFFSQIGPVKNVIMIRDKKTDKHKGFGYVEMQDLESIPACLLFNNMVPDFQKFPILVKASEAEKNFVTKKDPIVSSMSTSDSLDPRIYIGNIHVSVDENAIRVLAEQFGPIENMTLHRDEFGNSKGYCFVRYRSPESAQMAMTGLAGMELVGRPLKVGPVIESSSKNTLSAVQSVLGNVGGIGGIGGIGSIGNVGDVPNWKLDDDDGNKGMQMNAQSRHMLMAKLAQGAGMQISVAPVIPPTMPIVPPVTIQPMIPTIQGFPSRAFVIANMFDPTTETEPNWDQDIREDVMEECKRYGNVELVYVEKNHPGGYVYVKFNQADAAIKSVQSLHGRYFAGKMITVSYLDPHQFDTIVLQSQRR